uniref:Uncharacterized protein n=1 Tax=Tanacetum cinerariifolium TaxID=118510 RepID=A0A6L2NUQ1_TANCI|nr:hypothetical protein [Tanacetum cinerariifolium]
MEGYETDKVNLNPTQIFSVHNWNLKKNQPEGPHFTAYMLAIYNAVKPMAFQAPNSPSYIDKKVPQGKLSGAKIGHRKKPTSSKHHPMSKIKATKSTNPNVLVDKTKSARDGLETVHTVIGTNMDTSNAEKEDNFDKDDFNTSPDLSSFDDATKEIKLEDLSKLVKDVDVDFMDLDSPGDDKPIIVQDEEEKEAHAKEVYVEQHTKTDDFSVPKPLSPKTIRIQDPQKTSSKSEGELVKNKGKKSMSHEETKEKDPESVSGAEIKLTGSMGESSKKKHLKKFDFVTKQGENVRLTVEQIKEQNRIKELVKADMAKKEKEIGKE